MSLHIKGMIQKLRMQTIYMLVKNIFLIFPSGKYLIRGRKNPRLLRAFSFTGNIAMKSELYEIG